MNEKSPDPLDLALGGLPREVQPGRDLWAGIRTQIEASPVVSFPAASRAAARPWMRLAAGFLLVVASSFTTYLLVQQSAQQQVQQARQSAATQLQQAPSLPAMPVSFGGREELGKGYLQAREALDAQFKRQVELLPPVTRAKLERNLADLRRAASEISATLAEHPSNPLLQELLLSTYQSELALLGSVGEVTASTLNQPSRETRL